MDNEETPEQNALLFQRWAWMKKYLAEKLAPEFPCLYMWWSETQQEEKTHVAVRGKRVLPAPSRTVEGLAHVTGEWPETLACYVQEFEHVLQKLMRDPGVLRGLYRAYEAAHLRRPERVTPTGHGFRSLGRATHAVVDVQDGVAKRDCSFVIELNDWDQPRFEELFAPVRLEDEDVRQSAA